MREGFSFPDVLRSVPLVAVVTAAVLALYWPTCAWLLAEWSASESLYEYGIPVVIMSAVLILMAAARIPAADIRPFWPATIVVAGLSIAWLLANAASVANFQTLVLPFSLLAALVAVLGLKAGRALAPGVLYSMFALPIWDTFKAPLRDLTTVAVEGLLKIGGVPALIEGSLVYIPSGTFRIASGCSGLNFFIVGLAIAALYGHVFYSSWKKRVLLLAIGVGLAILGNWVRVATIIAIGDATEMQSDLVGDHQNFGWMIFAILQVPFFLIAMRLGRNEPQGSEAPVDGWVGARLPKSWAPAAVAALATLAVGPAWAKAVESRYADGASVSLSLPAAVQGHNGPTRSGVTWRPEFIGVSGEKIGQYRSPEGVIWMYVNVYLSQDQGRELIYIHNRIEGEGEAREAETLTYRLPDGDKIAVRVVDVDEGFQVRRIAYWYEIDGRRYVSQTRAKIAQALAVLMGRPEAGVVAFSAVCDFDCTAADDRIVEFIAALGAGFRMNYANMDEAL